MKILLADSQTGNLGFTKRILEKAGYQVIITQYGDKVLEFLRNDPGIALVIIDFDLVGQIQGPGLLRIVKEQYPDLPWLATSASIWEGIPYDKLLVKQILPEVLIRAVRQALEDH